MFEVDGCGLVNVFYVKTESCHSNQWTVILL